MLPPVVLHEESTFRCRPSLNGGILIWSTGFLFSVGISFRLFLLRTHAHKRDYVDASHKNYTLYVISIEILIQPVIFTLASQMRAETI
jgi:hypothetical protein